MTLLWCDSLDYVSPPWIEATYGPLPGWNLGAAHPSPSRKSVQVAFGNLPIPALNPSSNPGSDVCIVGFLLSSAILPTLVTTFLEILAPNLNAQIRLRTRKHTSLNRVRIEAWSGDQRRRLLVSSYLDLSVAKYIELEARISASGRLRLRVDGVVDAYIDGVDTAPVVGSSWGKVQFNVQIVTGAHFRFSDIYLADGVNETKPLGPVLATLLTPWQPVMSSFFWAITRRPRLVLMLGQSNMNGRGDNPYTGQGRNPNTKVKIWNVETQSFESLTANVNTGNQFLPGNPAYGLLWGPEMMFSELVARMHEQSGDSNTSEVYIVKLAADASWVTPIPGVETWHPAILGNLSSAMIAQVQAAVATVPGGWTNFLDTDVFWHQGESEALTEGFPFPHHLYTTFSNDVFNFIEAGLANTNIHWHRTVMHKDTLAFFTGTTKVINQQKYGSMRGSITETSDIPITSDGIHLKPSGFDILGYRYFIRWTERVLKAESDRLYIKDHIFNASVDDDYIGVSAISKSATFEQADERCQDLMHAPSKALNSKTFMKSVPGNSLQMSLGGFSLPETILQNLASWTFSMKILQDQASPEQLAGPIEFHLT